MAPDEHIDPVHELARGATYEWVLSHEPHPTEDAYRRLYPTIEMANENYAFAVDGWLGEAETPPAERTTYELIARFEVRHVNFGTEPPVHDESVVVFRGRRRSAGSWGSSRRPPQSRRCPRCGLNF